MCLTACTPDTLPPNLGDYDGKAPVSPGGGGPPGTGDASVDAGASALAAASNPMGIFIAGGFVYFTSYATGAGDGTVSVVATTGGAVQALATGQSAPQALTVAAGTVFFTLAPASGTGGVSAVPTSGGSVTPVQTGITGAYGIVADGANLYWTVDSSGVIVETVPLAGGTPKQLLDIGGDIHPQGLTIAGADLFIPTTGTQAAVLHGVTTGAGNLSPLDVQTPQSFADVTASLTAVYATLDDVSPSGAIIAYPRGTGSPVNVASSLNHPQRLALDGTNLYFTDPQGGNVWVLNLAITGATPTLFASGLASPLPIAVADAVYVGVQTAIVRLAKL